MKNEFRNLPVKLTEREMDAYGRTLDDKVSELVALELAKKQAADQFKGDIDRVERTVKILGHKVHTGIEDRDVECFWEPVYDRGVKELRRNDTMQVVETRPLTEEEKQRSLI
jgi:hypothetical protein